MDGFLAHLWWAIVTKVPVLMTYVVDFLKKGEHVIWSVFF